MALFAFFSLNDVVIAGDFCRKARVGFKNWFAKTKLGRWSFEAARRGFFKKAYRENSTHSERLGVIIQELEVEYQKKLEERQEVLSTYAGALKNFSRAREKLENDLKRELRDPLNARELNQIVLRDMEDQEIEGVLVAANASIALLSVREEIFTQMEEKLNVDQDRVFDARTIGTEEMMTIAREIEGEIQLAEASLKDGNKELEEELAEEIALVMDIEQVKGENERISRTLE